MLPVTFIMNFSIWFVKDLFTEFTNNVSQLQECTLQLGNTKDRLEMGVKDVKKLHQYVRKHLRNDNKDKIYPISETP